MMWNHGSMVSHGAGGFGGWTLMVVLMLVVAGGLLAVLAWIVRSLRSGPGSKSEQRSSLAEADSVLAERFASGEIDDDEFRRRHRLLHPLPGT